MTQNKSFIFNKVTYTIEEYPDKNCIDFCIKNPEKPHNPEILYKYFSVNNLAYIFSVDAFLNHYLYSSHPLNLNDKYDCSGDLLDFSKIGVEFYIKKLLQEVHLISEKRIKEIFNSNDRRQLINTLTDIYPTILYLKFGVISLAEKPDNILMWSYYAQNSGFVLKFNTDLLPKGFFGPFPINYSETLEKIDFTNYHFATCVLYQTNVKYIKWKPENEWRYLTYNSEGKYHPQYDCSDNEITTRKFTYDPKSVDEVILGYDFFNICEFDFNERSSEFQIINIPDNSTPDNWKVKFLNHIVDYKIKCSQIIRHRTSFKLDNARIKIQKLTDNKFKIYKQISSSIII